MEHQDYVRLVGEIVESYVAVAVAAAKEAAMFASLASLYVDENDVKDSAVAANKSYKSVKVLEEKIVALLKMMNTSK